MREIPQDMPELVAQEASKSSGNQDWQVQINLDRVRAEDEFDVIVIGSGIGGLGCAGFLSKRGYRVLVLEHRSKAGGYYRSFDKDDVFFFNTGAIQITGLWPGGPFSLFLEDLGFKASDFFVRNSLDYQVAGVHYSPHAGVETFSDELARSFPDEQGNIKAFFDDAGQAHDEWFAESMTYGVPLPPETIARISGEAGLEKHLHASPHYLDWRGKSLKQKLEGTFDTENIIRVLGSILSQPYGDLGSTSGLAALHAYAFIRYGSHFPREGAGKLARAIVEQIEKNGGKVLLERMVDSIVTDQGTIVGVKSGDEIFRSPAVVSNASIKKTMLELVDPRGLDARYVEGIHALKMHRSYCIAFLGIDQDLSAYPSMSLVEDEQDGDFVLLSINSNADPYYAPEGQASMTMIAEAAYADFPERETPEYDAKKLAWADHLIDVGSRIIPGLREHIIVNHAATPKTLERYTLAPEGSALGISWSTAAELPGFKTPIQGLYLAGASTYPGAGVDNALISGLLCALDVSGWKPR